MTEVISGFPGIGKTVVHQHASDYGWRIIDSDSSTFSWAREGIRNPKFPANYMNHIKGNIGFARLIMVSSHDVVREALMANDIHYTLIYPSIELKDEYLQRYRDRHNSEAFLSFIDHNWEKFIADIEAETWPRLVKLERGQYLADVLESIGIMRMKDGDTE